MAQADITIQCRNCKADITYVKVWTEGGINDKGGWVIRCNKCDQVFDEHVGKDVNHSGQLLGAKLLASYDSDVGDRDSVLKKFGLTP